MFRKSKRPAVILRKKKKWYNESIHFFSCIIFLINQSGQITGSGRVPNLVQVSKKKQFSKPPKLSSVCKQRASIHLWT